MDQDEILDVINIKINQIYNELDRQLKIAGFEPFKSGKKVDFLKKDKLHYFCAMVDGCLEKMEEDAKRRGILKDYAVQKFILEWITFNENIKKILKSYDDVIGVYKRTLFISKKEKPKVEKKEKKKEKEITPETRGFILNEIKEYDKTTKEFKSKWGVFTNIMKGKGYNKDMVKPIVKEYKESIKTGKEEKPKPEKEEEKKGFEPKTEKKDEE